MKSRFLIGLAFAVVTVATLQVTVATVPHKTAETVPPNLIIGK